MTDVPAQPPHTLHIPVMGTGFTVDTPLRVARYGISSVISIGDDVLLEQMRRHHAALAGEPYTHIERDAEDARARRITAYLDLMHRLVLRQSAALMASPFEPGSEITRYFEMLPDGPLRSAYLAMLAITDAEHRRSAENELRSRAVPGSIDVNILTKADGDRYLRGRKLPPEMNVAMSALRGFARSTLRSSVVFSAGMNPRLYRYAATFEDFFPDATGVIPKRIVLKVSDFRSAIVQGKFLAKRGLWVSEYRIESGLNCGGHAFATSGHLLGPILEEFRARRSELVETVGIPYEEALRDAGRTSGTALPGIRITVQGGIGTPEENAFLLSRYEIDGTGWGTPFLLVPEVTNVDEAHLTKLTLAGDQDVILSQSSPFGIPFWNLMDSSSERARRRRIAEGRPGSPCPKGYLASSTEFSTVPLCPASRAYQSRKLAALAEGPHTGAAFDALRDGILAKSCICNDLAGAATVKNGIDVEASAAICCGPGISYFSRIMSLDELMAHIYGRKPITLPGERPHMFIRELGLSVDHLEREIDMTALGVGSRSWMELLAVRENLLAGIAYYRRLGNVELAGGERDRFLTGLEELERRLPVADPDLVVTN